MNKIKQCNLTSFALLWCSFQILQHLWRKNSNNNKLLLFSFYQHHVQEQQQQQHQPVTVGSFIYFNNFLQQKDQTPEICNWTFFLFPGFPITNHLAFECLNQPALNILTQIITFLHFIRKNIFQPDVIKVVFSPLMKATCPRVQRKSFLQLAIWARWS